VKLIYASQDLIVSVEHKWIDMVVARAGDDEDVPDDATLQSRFYQMMNSEGASFLKNHVCSLTGTNWGKLLKQKLATRGKQRVMTVVNTLLRECIGSKIRKSDYRDIASILKEMVELVDSILEPHPFYAMDPSQLVKKRTNKRKKKPLKAHPLILAMNAAREAREVDPKTGRPVAVAFTPEEDKTLMEAVAATVRIRSFVCFLPA
jgi:hypothetical protein